MPRGSKASYSSKQKRKARKIEQGYTKKGSSRKRAERIAWATVNKQDGGGKAKSRRSRTSSKSRGSRSGSSRSSSRSKSTGRSSRRKAA